jgi:hypothetical protein
VRARTAALAAFALALGACEGGGDGGGGLVVHREPIAFNCTPFPRSFPSGIAILSASSRRASLALPSPPSVWSFDLDAERPLLVAVDNIGADSDGDGMDDEDAMRALLGFPLSPVTGDLDAPADDLALVSTSGYEQVVVYDAGTAESRSVFVETPASFPSGRYPLLPPPGETHLRTGISTLACIFPPDPFDSEGNAIGGHAACDPAVPSYLTSFTAGKALAGGRLFVATSNLAGNDRFRPGTVLVYEWIESGGSVRVRPDPTTPVLFTEGFNASGVRRAVTAGGRELVLVTSTGAIGQGTGPGNILTESAIEVIDPSVPRIVAVIPLGFAGPSFDGLAVDAGGRIGWVGASSQRQLYAVDLRALDEPNLYAGAGPPVILDGLSVGFPDARIFTADTPFLLPDRDDGAPSVDCDGFTHAAVNAAASEVFATDFCDGTFTRVRMDLSGDPPVPWPRARFQVAAQQTPFAPVRADTFGLLRAPGALRVRPGSPGVDYASPDVLVVVGQPEGQLCALRVESP